MSSLLEACEYYGKHQELMKSMLLPLSKHLNISCWGYQRITAEGLYCHLHSDTSWAKEYAKKQYALIAPNIISLDHIESINYDADEHAADPASRTIYQAMRQHLGVNRVKYCIIKNKDYYEVFCFANHDGERSLLESLVANGERFNSFYQFFHESMAVLSQDFFQHDFDIATAKADAFYKPDSNNPVLQSIAQMEGFKCEMMHQNQGQSKQLTPRETQCLVGMIEGKTIPQIAKEINISSRTVECFLANIKQKLEIRSRIGLIRYAYDNDIVLH